MITLLAGLFTNYLVVNALLTVRSVRMLRSVLDFLLALVALSIGIAGVNYGFQATQSTDQLYDGFPAGPYFFFGVVATILCGLAVDLLACQNTVFQENG